MPNSLRKRVKKMAYKGEITSEEAEKIRLALEKQIPSKPIILSPHEFALFECPSCHDKTQVGKFNYCQICGKKLDWSE